MFSQEEIKEAFNEHRNTDSDYFFVIEDFYKNGWGLVPAYNINPEVMEKSDDNWETIDEAIDWCFKHGWSKITFYDLYADSFETAFIKTVEGGK